MRLLMSLVMLFALFMVKGAVAQEDDSSSVSAFSSSVTPSPSPSSSTSDSAISNSDSSSVSASIPLTSIVENDNDNEDEGSNTRAVETTTTTTTTTATTTTTTTTTQTETSASGNDKPKDQEGMRFAGFQGQWYTIPAQSGEVYNLITFPNFQMNARFVYLPAQECPEGVQHRKNTTCPARAGTYIDQLGVGVGHEQILIESHPKGMRVKLHDKHFQVGDRFQVGSSHYHTEEKRTKNTDDDVISITSQVDMSYVPDMRNSTIIIDQTNHMKITCPLFTITIINVASSGYLDMSIALLRGDWIRAGQIPSTATQTVDYPKIPLHGLLGQTWKNTWNTNDRAYEGDVIDYLIASRDPFGISFDYNLYDPNL